MVPAVLLAELTALPVVVVTWFTALPAEQVTVCTVLPAMVVTPVYVSETVATTWDGGWRMEDGEWRMGEPQRTDADRGGGGSEGGGSVTKATVRCVSASMVARSCIHACPREQPNQIAFTTHEAIHM